MFTYIFISKLYGTTKNTRLLSKKKILDLNYCITLVLPGASGKANYLLVETEAKTGNDDYIVGADTKMNNDNNGDGANNDYRGGSGGDCCGDDSHVP